MSMLESAFVRRRATPLSARGERRAFKIPGLSKLRIGGSIGKAAEAVKHAKVAGIPVVAGIQAAGGNPAGAFESIRDGHSVQQGAKDAAGYLEQGAKNLPLAFGLQAAAGGGVPGAGGGAPGGDLLSTAIDFIKNNGGKALDLGLGTAGMINAAQLGKKSSDYATGAYDQAQNNWKSREPLRLAGVEGMLHPVPTTDVTQIGTKARAANPFASPFPKPQAPLALPTQTNNAPQPPMVLGKPTTDVQAQQALDRVHTAMNGSGTVQKLLRAAQGGGS